MPKTDHFRNRHISILENALKTQLGATDEILAAWETEGYPADGKTVSDFWGYIKEAPEVKIVGDYDADGICASYILSKAIKSVCPGKKVGVRIPRRFSEGYGINDTIADEIIQTVQPGGLVITVDNGITAASVLERIHDAGFKVIVTDHHELKEGGKIPDVDMVIDPAVKGLYNPFTGRYWCGAAVTYKLCEPVLSEELNKELEVYAGLATVADCMDLKEGNWGIVRKTIKTFRDGKAPQALSALLIALGQDPNFCNEEHFSFYLGPAFNAPGRLMDRGALEVLKYLVHPTEEQLDYLIKLNNERKQIRDEEYEMVKNEIERTGQESATPIWVAIPGLHEGIVGILAGKIAEEYNRPAIVVTNIESNPGYLKGSARGIEDFNIFKYLIELGNQLGKDGSDGFYSKIGGHAGAAGLTLSEEHFDLARSKQKIETATKKENNISLPIREWEIPVMKETLDKFRPFGEGNPAPSFLIEVDTKNDNARYIGENENHLLIQGPGGKYKITHFNHIPNGLSDATHFGMKGNIQGSAFRGIETPTFNAKEVYDLTEEKEMEITSDNI